MKHIINVKENKLSEVEETAEDIAQKETDMARDTERANAEAEAKAQAEADKEAEDNLKASAKTKLMAGEPMTEEEANLTLHINNEQS